MLLEAALATCSDITVAGIASPRLFNPIPVWPIVGPGGFIRFKDTNRREAGLDSNKQTAKRMV